VNLQLSTAEINAIADAVAIRVVEHLRQPAELAADRLLTENEVASITRVEPHTIRDARRRGELTCVRVGRFPRFRRRDVDEWLDGRTENNGPEASGSSDSESAGNATSPIVGKSRRRNGEAAHSRARSRVARVPKVQPDVQGFVTPAGQNVEVATQ
jgi:excisionase family DNA binding protein